MRYKKISFFFLLYFLFLLAQAQDPVFSQYYSSSLYLNPALAGTEHNITFNGIHRTQWANLSPYRSNLLSFIFPLHRGGANEAHLGGIGASFANYSAGDGSYTFNQFLVSGAYNLPIPAYTKQNITFGLQIGAIQKQLSTGDYQFGTQYNPNLGYFDPTFSSKEMDIQQSSWSPDIGAGFLYYYNAGRDYHTKGYSGYLGISGSHLNRPTHSFTGHSEYTMPVLLKMHGGVEFHLNERFNISPNILMLSQNDQIFNFKNTYQIDLGAYLTYELSNVDKATSIGKIVLGTWHRFNDSFIFALGAGNKFVTLAFSFDMNTSSLRTYTGGRGAYELSIKLQKPTINKMRKFHTPLM